MIQVVGVIAAGVARIAAGAVAATARVLGAGAVRLAGSLGRMTGSLGRSVSRFFGGAGRKLIKFNARKAFKKLDRFEDILEEVKKDAVVYAKAQTSKVSGNARRNTKYKNKEITLDYSYATYIDVPGVQRRDHGGNPAGISKPTEKWIKKELLRRIKQELGR